MALESGKRAVLSKNLSDVRGTVAQMNSQTQSFDFCLTSCFSFCFPVGHKKVSCKLCEIIDIYHLTGKKVLNRTYCTEQLQYH